MHRPDYEIETEWVEGYINNEAKKLAKKIPNFKEEQF
jgi:hypothetical protein